MSPFSEASQSTFFVHEGDKTFLYVPFSVGKIETAYNDLNDRAQLGPKALQFKKVTALAA